MWPWESLWNGDGDGEGWVEGGNDKLSLQKKSETESKVIQAEVEVCEGVIGFESNESELVWERITEILRRRQ